MFKQICKELRILDCHFTPASLRPGGAMEREFPLVLLGLWAGGL
jgi:hypothetical protein